MAPVDASCAARFTSYALIASAMAASSSFPVEPIGTTAEGIGAANENGEHGVALGRACCCGVG
jgi:hypothetical protein